MDLTSQDFRNRRQQMLNLLKAIEDLARKRDKTQIGDQLAKQAEHLRAGELNVVVCGECRRGKSSLLNAFLEDDGLCPVDAPVTTNAISRIGYGAVERIAVKVKLPDGTSQTHEITRAELRRYVTEEGNGRNARLVELVDIRLPNPKLKEGLVLYDTPGVGSLNIAHAATTYGIIPFADAVIFVGAATEPLATPELRFLKDIAKHKPLLLHVITKQDYVDNAAEILRSNLEKVSATLEQPLSRLRGVSVSSKYKIECITSPDPEILSLSGFQQLESALWELLQSGGDFMLGRAQTNAFLAISQLLPPLEAEHAALAETSKAKLDELDAKLKEQQDRGKELAKGAQEWVTELHRRGKHLCSQTNDRWDDVLIEVKSQANELLTNEEYLNDPDALGTRLSVECSNHFACIVKDADGELGEIVADLRELTSLNPSADTFAPTTDLRMRIRPPLPHRASRMEKVSVVGTNVARNSTAFGAVGGILGAIAGTILPIPGVGTVLGAQVGAGFGALLGSLFGVKSGVVQVVRNETVSARSAIQSELDRNFAQAHRKARAGLDQFLTDALTSIEKSLRSEIHTALEACTEAREALATERNHDHADTGKRLRERAAVLQQIRSWIAALREIVPGEAAAQSADRKNASEQPVVA